MVIPMVDAIQFFWQISHTLHTNVDSSGHGYRRCFKQKLAGPILGTARLLLYGQLFVECLVRVGQSKPEPRQQGFRGS
jgi:hypothetical protein